MSLTSREKSTLPARAFIVMKKTKTASSILTYEEYQEKIKGLNSSEEIEKMNEEIVPKDSIPEEKVQIKIPPKETRTSYFPNTRPIFSHRNRKPYPVDPNERSPWYDVVANDTDAIAIDLHAKGLTTRDIMNHLKRTRGIETSQTSISNAIEGLVGL